MILIFEHDTVACKVENYQSLFISVQVVIEGFSKLLYLVLYLLQVYILQLCNIVRLEPTLKYFVCEKVGVVLSFRKISETLAQMVANSAIIIVTHNKGKLEVGFKITAV